MGEDDDMCTSLNIPGARFIQRDVLRHPEISRRIRTSTKTMVEICTQCSSAKRENVSFLVQLLYHCIVTSLRTPTLEHRYLPEDCVSAMAKQKLDFVRRKLEKFLNLIAHSNTNTLKHQHRYGRRMSISSSSSSMSSVSLIGMKKRVVKRKNETKKKKKKKKKASENETQNEFSRRVSGILMRAINNRTKDKRKKKSPHVRQWRTFVGKILKNEILRPELSNKVRERIESIVNELAQISVRRKSTMKRVHIIFE